MFFYTILLKCLVFSQILGFTGEGKALETNTLFTWFLLRFPWRGLCTVGRVFYEQKDIPARYFNFIFVKISLKRTLHCWTRFLRTKRHSSEIFSIYFYLDFLEEDCALWDAFFTNKKTGGKHNSVLTTAAPVEDYLRYNISIL